MDYKFVFTNLCLEFQQNRSWIKGLGKNPQKSELIHWRQCLLSGGTEACSLGLRETLACIHVIQRLSQPRVACWHGFRQNSQKTECVYCLHAVRQAVEGVKNLPSHGGHYYPFSLKFLFWGTWKQSCGVPLSPCVTHCVRTPQGCIRGYTNVCITRFFVGKHD